MPPERLAPGAPWLFAPCPALASTNLKPGAVPTAPFPPAISRPILVRGERVGGESGERVMLAYHVTQHDLDRALYHTSKLYDGNVFWNRHPERRGNAFRFTLRCVSSRGPGHRMTVRAKPHRLTAACWHVHRDFLRALFAMVPSARVKTAVADYRGREGFEKTFPDTAHRNIGSMMAPVAMADACECME